MKTYSAICTSCKSKSVLADAYAMYSSEAGGFVSVAYPINEKNVGVYHRQFLFLNGICSNCEEDL